MPCTSGTNGLYWRYKAQVLAVQAVSTVMIAMLSMVERYQVELLGKPREQVRVLTFLRPYSSKRQSRARKKPNNICFFAHLIVTLQAKSAEYQELKAY